MANPVGKPPIINNSAELEERIEAYFAHCDQGETVQVVRRGEAVDVTRAIPYTVPDLGCYLGGAGRQFVWALKQRGEYTDSITRALARIEGQRVRKALNGEQESRFAQFDLVNNFKYVSSAAEITVHATVAQVSDDELEQRIAQLEAKMRPEMAIPCGPIIECEPQPRLLNPNNIPALLMEQKEG